jgi:CBS domain-containing protein
MSVWQVRRLAVTNDEGQLVGMLTQSQVVRYIADHIHLMAASSKTGLFALHSSVELSQPL